MRCGLPFFFLERIHHAPLSFPPFATSPCLVQGHPPARDKRFAAASRAVAAWLADWLLCTGAGCAVYLLLLRQRRPADAPDPVTDLLDAATDASTHSAGGSALAASGEGGDFAGGVDALPDSAAEGIVDGVADAGGAAEKGARRR